MDDIDRRLIALLRTDARASVASLAKALRVSRGTVQNRMARLQSDGTVVGFTLRLKPDDAGMHKRLGDLLAARGRCRDAEACYRAALRLTPTDAACLVNLAAILRQLDRFEEAAQLGA